MSLDGISHPPLIWVSWRDSAQAAPQWQWLDQVESPTVTECLTVGFLIRETEDQILIAISVAAHDRKANQASGIVAIPTRSIIERGKFISSSSAAGKATRVACLVPVLARKRKAS
jgi:hypothetical protein